MRVKQIILINPFKIEFKKYLNELNVDMTANVFEWWH